MDSQSNRSFSSSTTGAAEHHTKKAIEEAVLLHCTAVNVTFYPLSGKNPAPNSLACENEMDSPKLRFQELTLPVRMSNSIKIESFNEFPGKPRNPPPPHRIHSWARKRIE